MKIFCLYLKRTDSPINFLCNDILFDGVNFLPLKIIRGGGRGGGTTSISYSAKCVFRMDLSEQNFQKCDLERIRNSSNWMLKKCHHVHHLISRAYASQVFNATVLIIATN